MKSIFFLILLLLLSGCSSKSSSYIFPSSSIEQIANTKVDIGIKKVVVPSYLDSEHILLKDGIEVKSLDADFADIPSKLLTQKSINILKKSLSNPNVFLYPWEAKSKIGYIVDIHLDNFMYDSGYVAVNGSYYITRASGSTIISKNFLLKRESSKDVDSIVRNLSELFDKLIIEIAQKIAR